MYGFIYNIYLFLKDILNTFYSVIGYYPNTSLNITNTDFLNWLDKQVLNGDLLSINMTFKELFIYFGTLLVVVLSIILFIRYFLKLLGLFRLD